MSYVGAKIDLKLRKVPFRPKIRVGSFHNIEKAYKHFHTKEYEDNNASKLVLKHSLST